METGNSVEELQSSQLNSPPKLESAHLRADAVSLEIPVNVHGSLVSNASAGASPQAQPFEEQTSTMIVFPQGGVLRMSTPVTAGHVMVLTNLKSRQDAICRVVKVRAFAKAQSYVEIEFTSPQPGYWGVYFPSDGPEVRRVAPPPAAGSQAASPTNASPALRVAAPPVERKAPEVLRPSAAPAIVEQPAVKPPEPRPRAESPAIVPPRPPAPPKLPQSSFASLGTQEDILAPADSTRSSRATSVSSNSLTPRSAPDADITDAIDALIVPSARASSSPVTSYAAPREPSLPPPSLDAGSPMFSATPSLSDNGALESRLPLPKQMFGVALDDASQSYGRSAQSLGSKIWLPIGIAALLAVGAAAAYHFYFQPFSGGAALSSTASAAPAPASQPVSQPAVSASAQPSDAQAVTPAESAPANSASLDSASSSAWT
ncbi:MAG: hypothetical protein KGL02_09820, partial [Acidobacteriota bacterium]|nr:hypothetical protein [Acidobacteriota bacterium]